MSPHTLEILRAATALMGLTALMWAWMLVVRLRAMARAGISPQDAAHVADLGPRLPSAVRRVADNHNHLFEAPTVFYAAMAVLALLDAATATEAGAAWAFVLLRVSHSLVQATVNRVSVRFTLFVLSWIALLVLIGSAAWAVFVAAPS